MVTRLREQGIRDEVVLAAMARVPRHLFVEEAFASRAYEDTALPIGFGQTISQPTSLPLLQLARSGRALDMVLGLVAAAAIRPPCSGALARGCTPSSVSVRWLPRHGKHCRQPA